MNLEVTEYLVVAVGSAIGGIFRIAMGKLLPVALSNVPVRILVVNLLGCFFMGLVSEMLGIYCLNWPVLRTFLLSGLLGGFTTLSAFTYEFGILWRERLYFPMLWYTVGTVIFGISAFFVGAACVRGVSLFMRG